MANQIDIYQAAIYVGTYAKYNNGSLFGKWLNLSDYASIEEFYEACAELHKDEHDPEYMFQDYEHIPENLVSECGLKKEFFEIRDAIIELSEDDQTAFYIWLDHESRDFSSGEIADLIQSFQDAYIGKYDSEEDYAREIIEDCYNLPEFALQYFDYEKYANDLFCDGYWIHDGYVFYR
ncbi:antirestriction protein ArdA [Chitinophaga sp. CC14]|uniref:antirestriction protein ArdA n=1 Tax=Chitinophaga sp. CC14 TaxID=3029199 RepID=UPI003B7B2656